MIKIIQNKTYLFFKVAVVAAVFLFPAVVSAQYYVYPSTPTRPVPIVYSGSATNITKDSATFSVSVNPNGYYTEVWFEYGTSQSLLNQKSQNWTIGTNSTNISFTATGLLPLTTYYFRAAAINSYGTVVSNINSFKTLSSSAGSAPIAITEPVSSINQNIAVLSGSVNANYLPTIIWFEYGNSYSLGYTTSYQSIGNSGENRKISVSISGLQENIVYYYRIAAQNAAGTSFGGIMSFPNQVGYQAVQNYTGATYQQTSYTPSVSAPITGQVGVVKQVKQAEQPVQFYPSLSFLPQKKTVVPKIVEETVKLEIKTDVENPVGGGDISYTFSYKNNGDFAANEAVLKAVLPGDVNFVSSIPEPDSEIGNNLSFKLGDIDSGKSGIVVIKAKITALVSSGDALIASGVLNYKDSSGELRSANSYLASIVSKRASATASLLDIWGTLAKNWLFDLVLGLFFGYGIYTFFVKAKKTDVAS